jgi:alkylated DNA repair protein (DNA oxidative demethylase)
MTMLNSPPITLAPDIWLLPQFADTAALRLLIDAIAAQAPFRHMTVPGGKTMKVALTNCGHFGWTSDEKGYRYSATDPTSGLPWPMLPLLFEQLGRSAASTCGYESFAPDACLVNRYVAGAGMGLHQDRDEKDFTQPIVSVSLGAPCKFIIGGLKRSDPTRSFTLNDGDVMVWGGAARTVFHGVRPLPAASAVRHNITLRKAM